MPHSGTKVPCPTNPRCPTKEEILEESEYSGRETQHLLLVNRPFGLRNSFVFRLPAESRGVATFCRGLGVPLTN